MEKLEKVLRRELQNFKEVELAIKIAKTCVDKPKTKDQIISSVGYSQRFEIENVFEYLINKNCIISLRGKPKVNGGKFSESDSTYLFNGKYLKKIKWQ